MPDGPSPIRIAILAAVVIAVAVLVLKRRR